MNDTDIGQGADLIGIREVAAILNVQKRTAAAIAAGEGFPKVFKLNARVFKYSRIAVIEWLRATQEKSK